MTKAVTLFVIERLYGWDDWKPLRSDLSSCLLVFDSETTAEAHIYVAGWDRRWNRVAPYGRLEP